MSDYAAPAEYPYEDLPAQSTPIYAAALNGMVDALLDVGGAGGRVSALEARSGVLVVSRIAAVALSGHRLVTPNAAGQLVYASADEAGHLHAPLWLSLGAASIGGQVEAQLSGPVDEPSWSWTAGGPVFLGVDGQITQTPPTAPGALFLAQVGVATGPTSVVLDRAPSILLI